MDVLSKLRIGDRLNIERYENDNTLNEKNILSAQLIDLDKNNIYISTPVYKGKKYFIYEGQKISIFFYRDTAVYQFYAEVIKQINTNITTFMVKPTSEHHRIQRRDHYRLPVVIDITIEKRQNGKLHCITKDLSGGGLRAICNEELEEGQDIKIELYLYKNSGIIVDGKIVRVIKDTITRSYELGIKFNKISQVNEDKIYAFIFERQRSLRKKGLI